ncbi:conserved hypothetical protein [Klebsiella quasipneumoniae subsp. quasipneumoniae]|nr:conserved hypothetical protein [Klebsiella quasipneumoniae subsp. quasipneumoniae]
MIKIHRFIHNRGHINIKDIRQRLITPSLSFHLILRQKIVLPTIIKINAILSTVNYGR